VVVCPTCRETNAEDHLVCQKCGTSLEPGAVALPPRRESSRVPIEIRKPEPPPKWRAVVILAAIGGMVLGAGAYLLFRPDPCDGTNFASDSFGYCLLVPDGWEAGPARFGAQVTLDQFAPPTGSATVVVEAVDLETGTGLEQWSEFVRERDEGAGLTPGPAGETTIDGTNALRWDVSVAAEGGESFLMREVVVVMNDIGWRITLNDLQDGFDTSAVVFDDMLDSWQFR